MFVKLHIAIYIYEFLYVDYDDVKVVVYRQGLLLGRFHDLTDLVVFGAGAAQLVFTFQ